VTERSGKEDSEWLTPPLGGIYSSRKEHISAIEHNTKLLSR